MCSSDLWLWGTEEIGAFEKLKKQICEEPVLLQPDQKKPFEVEVDASNYACSTVLMQHDDKNTLHPVVFFSKTMNEAQYYIHAYTDPRMEHEQQHEALGQSHTHP